MNIDIDGTDFNDEINTADLQKIYPSATGFEVNGLKGDDVLTSSFIGRNGVDGVIGGEGDDLMSIFPSFLSPIPITNYAIFFGGFGSDMVYLPSGSHSVSGFSINTNDYIEFKIFSSNGELTQVSVSPTTEGIQIGELRYLTEDIINGRIRSVGWDEYFFRADGNNADWLVKGLDTYSQYHSLAPQPGTQVNRLYNSLEGRHLFSSNETEIDILTGNGWKNEGVIYYAPKESTAEVFRFYIPTENRHFYTALESERDMIISNQNAFSGWEYEGAAFSAFTTDDFPPEAVAVVRYLSQDTGSHLYSTSTNEQNILNQNSNWVNEGIAWYGDSMTATTDLV